MIKTCTHLVSKQVAVLLVWHLLCEASLLRWVSEIGRRGSFGWNYACWGKGCRRRESLKRRGGTHLIILKHHSGFTAWVLPVARCLEQQQAQEPELELELVLELEQVCGQWSG